MRFDIAIERRLGGAHIRAAFQSDAGLTALFGPSGAGKTSILNMVAGLLKPDSGHVIIDGVCLYDSVSGTSVAPHERGAGYVFQNGRLFPHMRVRDNLRYGARFACGKETAIKWDDATAFLGIAALLDRWPRSLSGGEAQRVAIGRALLSGPKFLLMDEPLSSLDAARREGIMEVIVHIRDTLRLPILYVSHDRAEVDRLASKVIML